MLPKIRIQVLVVLSCLTSAISRAKNSSKGRCGMAGLIPVPPARTSKIPPLGPMRGGCGRHLHGPSPRCTYGARHGRAGARSRGLGPVIQFGKQKWVAPTLLWAPGTHASHWSADNACASWLPRPAALQQDRGHAICKVPNAPDPKPYTVA